VGLIRFRTHPTRGGYDGTDERPDEEARAAKLYEQLEAGDGSPATRPALPSPDHVTDGFAKSLQQRIRAVEAELERELDELLLG
jgi:hypothetical protein